MKNETKARRRGAAACRWGGALTQGARLAAAGYPKFLFRLAAARRARPEPGGAPRRHD